MMSFVFISYFNLKDPISIVHEGLCNPSTSHVSNGPGSLINDLNFARDTRELYSITTCIQIFLIDIALR